MARLLSRFFLSRFRRSLTDDASIVLPIVVVQRPLSVKHFARRIGNPSYTPDGLTRAATRKPWGGLVIRLAGAGGHSRKIRPIGSKKRENAKSGKRESGRDGEKTMARLLSRFLPFALSSFSDR